MTVIVIAFGFYLLAIINLKFKKTYYQIDDQIQPSGIFTNSILTEVPHMFTVNLQ